MPTDYGRDWEDVTIAGRLLFDGVYLQPAGEYFATATHAFWPPGRHAPMVPFLAVTGSWYPAVWLYNLATFGIALGGVYVLTRDLAGGRAAKFAALLFALWPSMIFLFGSSAKEAPLVALLPWAIFLYLRVARGTGNTWLNLGLCGVVIAGMSYVQPSFILLPLVFVAYEICRAENPLRIIGRAVIVWFAMLVVIAPWTYRNYQVFGEPVLISTNGGITLWVGNNPAANGDYSRDSEFHLDHMPELERSDRLQAMAVDWIASNPVEFAKLVPVRLLLTMGSDRHGAYWAVHRGAGYEGAVFDASLYIVNVFWLLALSMLFLPLLSRTGRQWLLEQPAALLLMLPLLYAVSIHSIVEGGDRHHIAAIATMAVLIGMIYGRQTQPAGGAPALHEKAVNATG